MWLDNKTDDLFKALEALNKLGLNSDYCSPAQTDRTCAIKIAKAVLRAELKERFS